MNTKKGESWRKRPKGKTKAFILSLLVLSQIVSGCVRPVNQVDSKLLNMGQGIEAVEKAQQQEIADKKTELQSEFERMYGDDVIGLDLTATEQRLTNELRKAYEEYMTKETKSPTLIKCKVEFYRDSLKEAQEKNWDIQMILVNSEKHIRHIKVEGYGFIDQNADVAQLENFETHLRFWDLLDLSQHKYKDDIWYFIYPKSVLAKYSLEELRGYAHPFVQLNKVSEYVFSSGIIIPLDIKKVNESKAALRQKYNEEFECVSWYSDLYCPVNDPDLVFELDLLREVDGKKVVTDLYLPMLAQKKMGEEINRILEEEGVSDWVVQYTRVETYNKADREIFELPWDTKNATNSKEFLKAGYRGSLETALIYMVESDNDSVEYENIDKIKERISALTDNMHLMNDQNRPRKQHTKIYVYKVRNKDKAILYELFRNKQSKEYLFETDGSLSAAYAYIAQIRGNSEGFDYLDVYGTKLSEY